MTMPVSLALTPALSPSIVLKFLRGMYEYHMQLTEQPTSTEGTEKRLSLPPTPAGSPYGFTDEDWEIVLERKNNQTKLFVVLGYQFQSSYYHSKKLKENIKRIFENVMATYAQNHPDLPKVDLVFKALSAGYGGHLFNEIARDIISSDIAVFEASDQNRNVMIEIGVALTWGIRVLPIRESGAPKVPSDISGQTYAEYTSNGQEFKSEHTERLMSM